MNTIPSCNRRSLCYGIRRTTAILVFALLCMMCSCATTTGERNEELEIVKSAIELADQYCTLGLYDDATAVYDQALQKTRDYRLVYNKAIAMALGDDLYGAVSTLNEGYEEFPHILAFKTTQAKFLQELGLVDETLSCYEDVLGLNPYDTTARKELIGLCLDNGLVETAHEHAIVLWNQGYISEETLSLIKESM